MKKHQSLGEVDTREAWVKILTPAERAARGKGHPYDFGFTPWLAATHPEIGPLFSALYQQIMFAPGGALSRAEREMTAAVVSCFY